MSKMRSSITLVWALILVTVSGCEAEIGRITFDDVGEGRTEVMVDAKKEVDFWTDLDVTKEEDISLAHAIMDEDQTRLAYSLVLYQADQPVRRLICDPFDVSSFDIRSKFKSITITLSTTRSFKYKGKMRCSTRVSDTGATVVEAALVSVDPRDGSPVDLPDSFKLSKADLIIKQ